MSILKISTEPYLNSSRKYVYMPSIIPNCESMPSSTIVMKKTNIHMLGKGNRASALGRTLKLSYGPLRVSPASLISSPASTQKWER
jgi:hypothetical protein